MMERRFWITHLLGPLLLFGICASLLEVRQYDLDVAGWIYAWEGHAWSLRNSWLLAGVLHTGARNCMVVLALVLLGMWLGGFWSVRLKPCQRGLGYLLASLLVSVSLVSLGKQFSHVDCPWSLTLFGGDRDYIPIFAARPATMPAAQCFPAGHASAGYGWLGIYFLLYHYRPGRRWWGLAGIVALGLLLGGIQQLRGAHFVSHDLWTAGISWSVATLLYPPLLGRTSPAPQSDGGAAVMPAAAAAEFP